MEVFTQVIGFVAMFFSVFSFQMNSHKKIILMQMAATVCFAIQYYLLGAYTGMVVDIIATVRSMIFYFREDKEWARSKWWIVIFMAAFAVSGIFTYESPVSLLAIFAMMLNTISFACTKPKLVRTTILISSPMFLIYNIIMASMGGIVNEVFVEISSVVGLLRYDIKGKN
ncbi:MAG: YgjV family protein [Lachnospiraceae bacterium]|nr:YgjV family protein [Lachnospiraceae bacterium]